MQNGAWEAILRQIPAQQQDQYMLVTSSGTEIALQTFLRIDADFVVVKGRLSGSQEQGRVFFIPYRHIDYFGTSKPVKDTEYHDVFGGLAVPSRGATPVGEVPPVVPSNVPAVPTNGTHTNGTQTPAPVSNGSSGSLPTLRSEVLERFRSSRAGSPASSPNLPRPNGT